MRTLLIVIALVLAPPAGAEPAPTAGDPARWPLPDGGTASVLRVFDPPAKPWMPGHRGVDLRAAAASPVLAPISGKVTVASTIVDRGVVVIAAGAVAVSLEPVSPSVIVGQSVVAGESVGSYGTGRSHCQSDRCLHWGLRVAGEYRDPLLLVLRYRAVLLP